MRGNNAAAAPAQNSGELDQLERLVDIQREIVVLVEQNAATERYCLALRATLVEEFDRQRQQESGWLRWWHSARRWLLQNRQTLPVFSRTSLPFHSTTSASSNPD